jgi:alpha-ketoglutarate-dependent taurine dioxygenase
MSRLERAETSRKILGSIQRKALSVSQEDLIQTTPPASGTSLPLVVEPAVEGVDLIEWAASQREWFEGRLLRHGAILFRGFHVISAADLERFIRAVSGEPLEYRERSTPRTQVSERIYTSTDYPAAQRIFFHNENSYQQSFPLKLFFLAVIPATRGGETPIADCRKVFQRIDPAIRERFHRRNVMYVRNLGGGLGLPWQTVFQTDDKSEVGAYCSRAGIEAEWRDADRLRLRSVLPAVATHPGTGELVWFNHAAFFHVSTLEPSVREAIQAEFREEDFPTNTYYGDGAPIEPAVLDHLRAAYEQEKVSFPWRAGDLLALDNMLAAHSREPFEGPRRILTGMSELGTRAKG